MRYLTLFILLLPILAYAESNEMHPYLQTPTSTSMYVCWFAASGNGSTVQYGTSESLGSTQTGDVHEFASDKKWHWVKLQNLTPNTRYYYKCITESQVSEIYSFTTAPTINTPNGHLRIIFIGDTEYDPDEITNVGGMVNAIQAKMLELYGANWLQKINLICHSGDIVHWTGSPNPVNPFINEYFLPFNSLSSSIPSMTALGNHEYDSGGVNVIYDLLKTEEICGPENEGYYSFDLANSKFIFLNSNGQPAGQGTTQTNWLESQLSNASSNSNTDFILTIAHHYGHSEIAPAHNTSWTQNTVIPKLAAIPKPTMLTCGHAHGYERGTHPSSRTRLVIGGGGGARLHLWGEHTPQDYPETHIALDYWIYTIVDIDLSTSHYDAKVFTLGNPDHPLNNILIDSWSQSAVPVTYQAKAFSAKAPSGGQIKLVSAPEVPYQDFQLMSSQVQVSETSFFSPNLVDSSRNWEDIFENTGSPSYTPIDVNAGIDLKRFTIPNGSIQQGHTYYWRIRYRSQNTDWGNWSDSQQFTYTTSPVAADFVYSAISNINVPVQFTDTSVGDPTSWAWDFDNNGTIDSSVQDPVWTFTTPGAKHVKLTVTINGQSYSLTKDFQIGTLNIDEVSPAVVQNVHIYPNPSQGMTNISFELKKSGNTKLEVFNMRGELIKVLHSNTLPVGLNNTVWDGKTDIGNLASNGAYIIRITTKGGFITRKVALIR